MLAALLCNLTRTVIVVTGGPDGGPSERIIEFDHRKAATEDDEDILEVAMIFMQTRGRKWDR